MQPDQRHGQHPGRDARERDPGDDGYVCTTHGPTPPISSSGGATITGLPSFCQVVATQADSSGNLIYEVYWLPDNWNGRFLGVGGGGGYVCGIGYSSLASGVEAGYATASTDCGVNDPSGGFALNGDDTLNNALIADFSSVGIHDMTVTGKAVTATYYSTAPTHSYFNGCSTGGREGLMEAQRYPADYNGIVSGAPAINWTKFIVAEIWPELVMNASADYLPSCKEQAFNHAVEAACGGLDGVIPNPGTCKWNPDTLVGLQTPCGTITSTDAAVVEKIWQVRRRPRDNDSGMDSHREPHLPVWRAPTTTGNRNPGRLHFRSPSATSATGCCRIRRGTGRH